LQLLLQPRFVHDLVAILIVNDAVFLQDRDRRRIDVTGDEHTRLHGAHGIWRDVLARMCNKWFRVLAYLLAAPTMKRLGAWSRLHRRYLAGRCAIVLAFGIGANRCV
jgi:hypothetical protein